VEDAIRAIRLEQASVNPQREEDGKIMLLPSGIDEPRVVAELVQALYAEISRANSDRGPRSRRRLRVAFHEGLTMLRGERFIGDAVATARMLCDSAPCRRALRDTPDAQLVMIVSQQIFDDDVAHGHGNLPATQFTGVTTAGRRGSRLPAWIYLPGLGPTDMAGSSNPAGGLPGHRDPRRQDTGFG
jgi:hypothetical protein